MHPCRRASNDPEQAADELAGVYSNWFYRAVGESTRFALGDELLVNASNTRLFFGTAAFSTGMVLGGYYGLTAFGVVGGGTATGVTVTTAGGQSLAAAGSVLTYTSLGFSSSRFILGGEGGDDVLSDLGSLGAELLTTRTTGLWRAAAYGVDFLANGYQGMKSAAASHAAFARGDYFGGTLSLIGAGLGLSTSAVRGAQSFSAAGLQLYVAPGLPASITLGLDRVRIRRSTADQVMVHGRVITNADEVAAIIREPYRTEVLSTFDDPANVAAVELTEGLTVYRRWGGGSHEVGSPYFSALNYSYPGRARRHLALPAANVADHLTEFVIPAGSKVLIGRVGDQSHNRSISRLTGQPIFGPYARGGGIQIFTDPDNASISRRIW